MAETEPASSDPGRTVSLDDAVRLTGVPAEYLAQLLDARTIASELVGGERRIPRAEVDAYRERRAGARLALRAAGAIRQSQNIRTDRHQLPS